MTRTCEKEDGSVLSAVRAGSSGLVLCIRWILRCSLLAACCCGFVDVAVDELTDSLMRVLCISNTVCQLVSLCCADHLSSRTHKQLRYPVNHSLPRCTQLPVRQFVAGAFIFALVAPHVFVSH